MEWLTKWKFFDKDGYIRLSTRWAAIQNGTTMEGNSANRVSEWWRQNGFIPEWMLPNNQELEWSQFYDTSCLTDEMRKCAEESKKLFSIKYEWILKESDYKASLQRGAIQVLTAVCPGWSSVNPIPACSLNVQHATELLNVQGDGKKDFWDSYDPHHKVFASDYPVPYRMLYLLKPIPQINEKNMILKKEKGKNDIWLIIEKNKTKINITDMPTFTPLCEDFVEVDNLDEYSEN